MRMARFPAALSDDHPHEKGTDPLRSAFFIYFILFDGGDDPADAGPDQYPHPVAVRFADLQPGMFERLQRGG